MDAWWLIFWWSGPIGVGMFLVFLGTFIWLLSKANLVNKQAKAIEQERQASKNG